ncbi:hypothetical protein DdX_01228 [Ditylenchus destructor]|uniref:Uncharacterized protein n=1 Tax=Ditylenchus destructor TaxID=166010 RepID=A0AAD4NL87_9BILA|nr:hypothetical protein DdX_01228 [Ditylenchus destructor]
MCETGEKTTRGAMGHSPWNLAEERLIRPRTQSGLPSPQMMCHCQLVFESRSYHAPENATVAILGPGYVI